MDVYCIGDNTHHYSRGKPWVLGAYADRKSASRCSACESYFVTDVEAPVSLELEPQKGTMWPDVIGCGGGVIGLYVSARVKGVFDEKAIRYGTAFWAEVRKPLPSRLSKIPLTDYYLLSGEFGARFDFAKSGQKIRSLCPVCKMARNDPSSEPARYQLVENSWNGSDIFFTDLSPAAMFGSERVLDLARIYRWSNFRFVPLESACDYSYKGLPYL